MDILRFGRSEAVTSAASIDRGCGPFPLHQQGIAMRDFCSVDDLALRKLLDGLFPNVPLSPLGVALLAGQLGDLDKRCPPVWNKATLRSRRSGLMRRPRY